jgi:hypothetical protein
MMGLFHRRTARILVILVTAAGGACLHEQGPEDPTPVPVPRLVSVSVQYRQLNGCSNTVTPCDGPVVFSGSWMRLGVYVPLQLEPGTFIWKGTVSGVPVNYPPRDQPYQVWVVDPYVHDVAGQGVTAQRLSVGGQLLTTFYPYQDTELGLVYIDDNGFGHAPF